MIRRSKNNHSNKASKMVSENVRWAKALWPTLQINQLLQLRTLTFSLRLLIRSGELLRVGDSWYVSHAGLLRIADRRHCFGLHSQLVLKSCDPVSSRWVFKATVFKSSECKGFIGYGDADPSNVSALVRGAEMRVAETRAVNRALRKAYGIGICSVEELGSITPQARQQQAEPKLQKIPPQSSNGNGCNVHGTNGNGIRVRDRLCQLIRQHTLDAELVKAYAVDFCGTKALRDASREQVESFVAHLADWAEKDRNALLCQLNSYIRPSAGAA
jgi:hypothetical protein